MELARCMLALCIPEVGRKTAKLLANHIASKMHENTSLFDVCMSLQYDELLAIKDIGPVGAEEVIDFIADNQIMLQKLLDEVHPTLPLVVAAGILS